MDKILHTRLLLPALIVAAFVAVLAAGQSTAFGAEVNHDQLPPQIPRTDIPITLDGFVYSTIQVGDRVIVAGDFNEVESFRNGPIITRNNIFAYDINTGAVIDDFDPNVNGAIFELVSIPETGEIFLGGAFTQVSDEFRIRVAKLDFFGNLDPQFRAEVSARVLALDIYQDVLYLGGNFTVVNGGTHDRIAAVDTTLGESVPGFNLQVVGDLGKADTRGVKALDVTPTGELLVAFNGVRLVDSRNLTTGHFGIAFVDLDTYLVTDWRTEWYRNSYERCSASALQLRDAELSPDGSTFVVVEKGHFNCDKAVAFNTVDDGVNNPKWVTAAHDSVFSVAVTNNAVYIGGHFCFLEAHGPVASSEAATYPWVLKPEACQPGGNQDNGEFLARYQIAALNPADGEPLDWNPTSNAQEAVFHIEAVDRGLLLGQDRNRVAGFRTGLHAFLDFGGTTPAFTPPAPPSLDCTATVDAAGVVTLAWNDLEDVVSYTVRNNNAWVASTTDLGFSDEPGIGSHEYVIRYRQPGVVTDAPCSPSPIVVEGAAASCTAVAAGGNVELSWVDQPGVSTWQVRRNGSWYASVDSLNFVDANPAPGTYSYELRYRVGGQIVDLACNPTSIVVQGETLACTVSVAGTTATIDWNQIDGVSSYQVRRDNRWLASTTGASHVDPVSTDGSVYEIRYRRSGSVITTACA